MCCDRYSANLYKAFRDGHPRPPWQALSCDCVASYAKSECCNRRPHLKEQVRWRPPRWLRPGCCRFGCCGSFVVCSLEDGLPGPVIDVRVKKGRRRDIAAIRCVRMACAQGDLDMLVTRAAISIQGDGKWFGTTYV